MKQPRVTERHIFTYGSLMFDEIWQRVTAGAYTKLPATAHGVKRTCIRGDCYPVAVPCQTARALSGLLYLNVTETDIVALDGFEGDYYLRSSWRVRSALGNRWYKADIYLLHPRFRKLASIRPWRPEIFSRCHLPRFIARTGAA